MEALFWLVMRKMDNQPCMFSFSTQLALAFPAVSVPAEHLCAYNCVSEEELPYRRGWEPVNLIFVEWFVLSVDYSLFISSQVEKLLPHRWLGRHVAVESIHDW